MASCINPEYRFRFSFDEIRSVYSGPEEAWAAGDFMLVSELAPEGSELRACSLVVVGLLSQGMEQLDRIGPLSPRGHLIKALGYWQLNQHADAIAALASIGRSDAEAAMAERLRDLIAAPEIRVIGTAAIVPLFTRGDQDALRPIQRFGQFKISHYATQFAENAWPNDLNDPFDEFIARLPPDQKPAFVFALTPQWFLPRNFTKAKVPRVLWCHDTDVFFNRAADNLAAYDLRLTCTSQEHFELQQALGRPCFSAIMIDPMPFDPSSPTNSSSEKDIDVLFTGAALRAFHTEKARFIYQLSALAQDFRVIVVDGHMPEPDYHSLLSRARFVPVINRYSGMPSPRWRDALVRSTCVLYPEGSGYGNIGPGCFPVREQHLVEDIARHIAAHRMAQTGSPYHPTTIQDNVKRHFLAQRSTYPQNMERLLKTVAFAALVWRPAPFQHGSIRQRSVWYTPPIDNLMFGQDIIVPKIQRLADKEIPRPDWDDRDYGNAAAINLHLAALYGDVHHPERRPRAYALLDRGLRLFPNSLLLRFNAAHWRFFETEQPNPEADRRFEEIITRFDEFEYSPTDCDVGLPVTFYERDPIFPYYDYCQHVLTDEVLKHTSALRDRERSPPVPAAALLAAAHGYLGLSAERRGDITAAVAKYKTSLSIYPDNLPLMRKCLHAMVQLSERGDRDLSLGNDLAQLFFKCAAKYPTVLLSELYRTAPALDRLKQHAAIAEIFAMWHRLGSIASRSSTDWFDDAVRQMMLVANLEPLFPPALRDRLAHLRLNPGEIASATQFEIAVLAATDFARSQNVAASARAGTPFERHYQAQESMNFPMPQFEQASPEAADEAASVQPNPVPFDDHLAALTAEAARLKSQVVAMQNSTSWRVTRPLRSLGYRIWKIRSRIQRLVH